MAYIYFNKNGGRWLTNLNNNNLICLVPRLNRMYVYKSNLKHLHDLEFDSKEEYDIALKKMLDM